MTPPNPKKHGPKHERNWQGIPLFGSGFRPFFLFAAVYAVIAMALWLAELEGYGILALEIDAVNWHQHEMLFGYTPAVIAGFLFTAVPNWTGRYPVAGWPLISIFTIWVAGRVVMMAGDAVPYLWSAAVDAAFLPALATVMGREIIAGNNRKNLKVIAPIILLALANLWFHFDMVNGGDGGVPLQAGFSAILLLISIIGGRVTPSFTRNYLARKGPGQLPTPINRYDTATLIATATGFTIWVFLPASKVQAVVFATLAILHTIRLLRWVGWRTFDNALLLALHVFYAFLPAGMAMMAYSIWDQNPDVYTAAIHVFGIGAIGGMTISVMVRASRGHTGHPLAAGPIGIMMFITLFTAVIVRVLAALDPSLTWAMPAAATLWIITFAVFTLHIGRWLIAKR